MRPSFPELPSLSPDVEWSVALRDAATGELLAQRTPQAVLPTASIGKLFLLVEAARRFGSGELDPAAELGWHEAELVADSGIWHLMSRRTLPARDLCVLIGAVSDNLATNVLVRHLGIDAIRATALAAGFDRSALLDRVRTERGPGMPETLSVGCADELSRLMVQLLDGAVVSPACSAQVLTWLGANTDLSMVGAAFGLDPLAHNEFDRGRWLINKTGTNSGVRADVGVVRSPERAVGYAVLAAWADGNDPRDRVLTEMTAIGAAIESWLQR